jgi:uncharacterized protein (TIGR00369 family)
MHPLIDKAASVTVPIAQLIGFQMESAADGHAVASFTAGPQHANPMGTLHGGVLCDVSDAAMGMAFVSTLADDESFTTMTLTINFFRPVWAGGAARGSTGRQPQQEHRIHRVRHHG